MKTVSRCFVNSCQANTDTASIQCGVLSCMPGSARVDSILPLSSKIVEFTKVTSMRRQSLSIASESRKETRSSCFGDTRRLGGDLKPSPCPTPLLDSTTVPFAPIDLEHGMEQFSQVPPQCNEAELQLLLHQEELMSGAVHLMETRETRITRGACILLSVVLFPAVCHLRERGKDGQFVFPMASKQHLVQEVKTNMAKYLYPTCLLF